MEYELSCRDQEEDEESEEDEEFGPFSVDSVMFGSKVEAGGKKFVYGKYYGCQSTVVDAFSYF